MVVASSHSSALTVVACAVLGMAVGFCFAHSMPARIALHITAPQQVAPATMTASYPVSRAVHLGRHATLPTAAPLQAATGVQNDTVRAAGWYSPATQALLTSAAAVCSFIAAYRYGRRSAMAATTGEKDLEIALSRRQALLTASTIAGLAASSPAFANGDVSVKEYDRDSLDVLKKIKKVLAIKEADDPSLTQKVDELTDAISAWLNKYRREFEFEEEPSYDKVYAAIRNVAKFYAQQEQEDYALFPAQEVEGVLTLVAEAEELLAKGL